MGDHDHIRQAVQRVDAIQEPTGEPDGSHQCLDYILLDQRR
jgi:hypothetical protein